MKPFAIDPSTFSRSLMVCLTVLFIYGAPALVSAQEDELGRPGPDQSGGWAVFEKGFATRSPIAAGEQINIRVLAVGNARGVAVTYSGNLFASNPGQLWAKHEVALRVWVRWSKYGLQQEGREKMKSEANV